MPLPPLPPCHPFPRLPPQVARHPQLHAPAAARRRPDDRPADERPDFVVEDAEGEMCGRPADRCGRFIGIGIGAQDGAERCVKTYPADRGDG